jgi:hypothetical protein
MSKGCIVRQYRAMSPEDRRTFDRWLKANAVFGSIFAAGLFAMALAGSTGPHDATVANNIDASKVACVRKNHSVSSPQELATSQRK